MASNFPSGLPNQNATTDLSKKISLGEYFNQPVNSLFPNGIDIVQQKYIENDANAAVRDYSWDGATYTDAVNKFEFQPLTSPQFANFTSNDTFQSIFPSACLFYGRTIFEHGLMFDKMTRLTYPQIVGQFSKAVSDAALTDKDAMNLGEIAIKYANCLTTGRFIVIPDASDEVDIMSDPVKADKLTNFGVRVEQKLSALRTPYFIGRDQSELKFEISQNMFQIFVANNLGFNGSDAAYNAVKNNEFTTGRGLSNIKQQGYYGKPVPLNTFTANASATFNGTSSDVNINKVMDYSFIGDIAGFLQANDSMVHFESPKIEENEGALGGKTKICKGGAGMSDHAVLPTHQPGFGMVLSKAPTYEDYKNAYALITALQPSMMGLYVNNPGQKIAAAESTPGNSSSEYDKMGGNDFVTLRTLVGDSSSNTYQLGQGSLTVNLKDTNAKYDGIKGDAQKNVGNYLFGTNSLFYVNDPNTALASGQNLLMMTADERNQKAIRMTSIDSPIMKE